MIPGNTSLPFYIRLTCVLLLVFLSATLLDTGGKIIMPLLLALLFAIQLRPLVIFFYEKLHFPRALAALTVVILFVIFIGSILSFISWQVSAFADDFPRIRHNLEQQYLNLQDWINEKLHISYTRQEKYVESLAEHSMENSSRFIGDTLASFTGTFVNAILVPVYVFLFLLYRDLLKNFLFRLVSPAHHSTLTSILAEIKIVIQSYITGLLIEMALVALLTSSGLFIVGVKHAALLGVITAILNLIPYLGILTAGILSILTALSENMNVGIRMVLGVVFVNIIVQLIDNNLLVPRIVASKVRINALVSIVGVFTGAWVAGVIGMFLAIPFIAILKVIFDRIDSLKPWGFLMGDDLPRGRRSAGKTEEQKVAEKTGKGKDVRPVQEK